jgi:hypothetical protein
MISNFPSYTHPFQEIATTLLYNFKSNSAIMLLILLININREKSPLFLFHVCSMFSYLPEDLIIIF